MSAHLSQVNSPPSCECVEAQVAALVCALWSAESLSFGNDGLFSTSNCDPVSNAQTEDTGLVNIQDPTISISVFLLLVLGPVQIPQDYNCYQLSSMTQCFTQLGGSSGGQWGSLCYRCALRTGSSGGHRP